MNIALSAVIIALLLTPGALFRIAYNRGSFKRSAIGFNPLGEDLTAIVLANLVIYPVALFVLHSFQRYPPYDVLVIVLTGNYANIGSSGSATAGQIPVLINGTQTVIDYVKSAPIQDLLQFFIICIVSWGLGYGFHQLVRHLRWDARFAFLRFTNNEWYYTLNPRPNPIQVADSLVTPSIIAIVAVDLKSETYLYRGEIRDYYLDRNGNLDRIELVNAARRPLNAEGDANASATRADTGENKRNSKTEETETDESRWYPILSENVLIKYADCRSLAIAYSYPSAKDNGVFTEAEILEVIEQETEFKYTEAPDDPNLDLIP